jgi:hypothetical protein
VKYTYYASDILEAAMELAQSKTLNAYNFRDCMNWLTELWQNCYERVAQIDEGFYSRTVKLTRRITHLPGFVKNTVRVYSAKDYTMHDEFSPRRPYRESSMTDLGASGTFHISGYDLYCADAEHRNVWCEYVPEPPFITFTKNNRDPKQVSSVTLPLPTSVQKYGSFKIQYNDTTKKFTLTSYYDTTMSVDITPVLLPDPDNYTAVAMIVDYPYVFMSHNETKTGDRSSWIYKDIATGGGPPRRFNPFDYMGRESRVTYCAAKWNDYTGMGCTVLDQDDNKYKELGWTPDTIMYYPSPIIRNYLVAHLAKKFADLNSASIMAVDSEIASADYQMANFLSKDKSAWFKFDRTVGPSLGDLL